MPKPADLMASLQETRARTRIKAIIATRATMATRAMAGHPSKEDLTARAASRRFIAKAACLSFASR